MSEQCVDGFDEAYHHKGDFAHLTVARISTKKYRFCGDACKVFVKGNKSMSRILLKRKRCADVNTVQDCFVERKDVLW